MIGVVLFVGFLVILCIIAGVFFIRGSVIFVISIVNMLKGKKTKALWILTIILYCISLAASALPIGWLRFFDLQIRNI